MYFRELRDSVREYGSKVSAAETAWEKTQNALSAARQQEQILLGRLEDARKTARQLEARAAELSGDGKTLQDREKEFRQVLLVWDAGKAVLGELEDKRNLFEGDPEAVLKNLERQLDAVQDLARKTRDEERKAAGNLETLGAQGPYSVLAQAEEEAAHLQVEIQSEERRMDAIRLLHDTLARCRTEAVASVARPVQEAATRLMQRIAGRRIGRIDIGESFEPSGVSPESAGSSVGLDNLSGGEQEQLYLATRLALAEVLAKDERQMVVLDDVLTATDAGRLARVMTLLEEAAQRLQILILTCHPERYRALAGAEFFDLESLVSGF